MKRAWFLTFVFTLAMVATGLANTKQVKLYQEVFGEKPKCISCHVDKLPKKGDGKHEPNEYGKKLRAAKEIPDAETYKSVGKNDQAVLAEE